VDPVRLHRFACWLSKKGLGSLSRLVEGTCFVMCSCVLPTGASIGTGTHLAYRGLGTVIHKRAVVGANVMIGPGVVLGGRSGSEAVARVEDDCFIGAGAKILGPVVVGRGSVVGANAVVVSDVPPRSVVAGVPARIIASNVDVNRYGDLPRPAVTRAHE
jgi:serine O-acetyltransferase